MTCCILVQNSNSWYRYAGSEGELARTWVEFDKSESLVETRKPKKPKSESTRINAVQASQEEEFNWADSSTPVQMQGPKVIQCTRCQNSWSVKNSTHRRNAIMNHVLSCIGVKPFSCSACDSAHTQRSNALTHFKKKCPSGRLVLLNRSVSIVVV